MTDNKGSKIALAVAAILLAAGAATAFAMTKGEKDAAMPTMMHDSATQSDTGTGDATNTPMPSNNGAPSAPTMQPDSGASTGTDTGTAPQQ